MEGHIEGIKRLCKFSERPEQINLTALYKSFQHFHYSVVDTLCKSSDNNNKKKKRPTVEYPYQPINPQQRNMQFAYLIIRAVDSK